MQRLEFPWDAAGGGRSSGAAGDFLFGLWSRLQKRRPVVHCIHNQVTAGLCADFLLAAGAHPIMAQAPEEVEEIVRSCQSLCLNLGTPSRERMEAMELAARVAADKGIPVVLDPVGVSASAWRLDFALHLLESLPIGLVRANGGEVAALAYGQGAAGSDPGIRGVEYARGGDKAWAGDLARRFGCAVLMSGAVDVVSDGHRWAEIANGSPALERISGAGCRQGVLCGAFLALEDVDAWEAAVAGAAVLGLAGDRAASLSREGDYGTFAQSLVDVLAALGDKNIWSNLTCGIGWHTEGEGADGLG